MGANDLDDPFFQKLAQVKRLQTDLKVPLAQLLSLWNNIETYRYETDRDDSLYGAFFLNKAVLNPPDGAFTLSSPPAPPQVVGDGKSESKITVISRHSGSPPSQHHRLYRSGRYRSDR